MPTAHSCLSYLYFLPNQLVNCLIMYAYCLSAAVENVKLNKIPSDCFYVLGCQNKALSIVKHIKQAVNLRKKNVISAI